MKPILPKSIISSSGLSQVCGVLTSPGTTIILAPPFVRGAFGDAHQSISLPTPSVAVGSQNVPQPSPVILPLAATKLTHSSCPSVILKKAKKEQNVESRQICTDNERTYQANKLVIKKEKGKESPSINVKKSIVKNILPKISQGDTRTLIIIPSPVPAFFPNVPASSSSSVSLSAASKVALKPKSAKRCKTILKKQTESSGDKPYIDTQCMNDPLPLKGSCEFRVSNECKFKKSKGSTTDVRKSKSKKAKAHPIPIKQNIKERMQYIPAMQNADLNTLGHYRTPQLKPHDKDLLQHSVPHHPPPPYPILNDSVRSSDSTPEVTSKHTRKEKGYILAKCPSKDTSHMIRNPHDLKISEPSCSPHHNLHTSVGNSCNVMNNFHTSEPTQTNCTDSASDPLSDHFNLAEHTLNSSLVDQGDYIIQPSCSYGNSTACSSTTSKQRSSGLMFARSRSSSKDPPSYSTSQPNKYPSSLTTNQLSSPFVENYTSQSTHPHSPSNNSPALLPYASVSNSSVPDSCHTPFSVPSLHEEAHSEIKRTTCGNAVSTASTVLPPYSSASSVASSNHVPQESSHLYITKGLDYAGSPLVSNYVNSSQASYNSLSQQASPYTGPLTPSSYSHSPQVNSYVQSPQPSSYVTPVHYDMSLHSSSYTHSPQQTLYSPSPQGSSYSHFHHRSSYSSHELSQSGLQEESQSCNSLRHPLAVGQEYSSSHQSGYCQSPETAPSKGRHPSDNISSDCHSAPLPPYSFSHFLSSASYTTKSVNMYANSYSSHHFESNHGLHQVCNKNSQEYCQSYCSEKFSSTAFPGDRSLSPPSYEAHFQNTSSFPDASQVSSDFRGNLPTQQHAASNYTLYSNTSKYAEQDFSSVAMGLRDEIGSPPAYPASSNSLSLSLPPPGYSSDNHISSVGQQLNYPFTPNICNESQDYSPLEQSSNFFPNTPPMLPPPAAPPPTESPFKLSSEDASQGIDAGHSASHSYFSNASSFSHSFEGQGLMEERTHKINEQNHYEYQMYGLDANSNNWKTGNGDTSKVHDLIEKAERLWFIPHQEQNRVYMKRKELAKDILKHSVSRSNRDAMLKEKFWIEEDEPISEEILKAAQNNNSFDQEHSLTDGLPHNDEDDIHKEDISSCKTKDIIKKKKSMLCQICGKILKGGISSLKSHLNSHQKIQPHACPYCSKSFTNRSVLVQHMRVHTGEKPYVCTICDTSFRTRTALKRHQGVHTNERPFECSMCSKAFKTKLVLQLHLKLHLTGLFTCPVCSKTFERRKAYVVHKASHHQNKKKFRCTHCSKSYRFRSLLNYHMQMHANIRKFVCSVCSEAFVWRSGLAAHMKTHSAFRPKCSICGACFPSEKRLEMHCQRHKNKKPHRCEECGQNFAYAYRLAAHKLVHQERKEFPCTKCTLLFNSSKKLKKHLNTHMSNEIAVCPLSETVTTLDTVHT